jgi:hypothetical protein
MIRHAEIFTLNTSIAQNHRWEGGWLAQPSYDATLIFGVFLLAITAGLAVVLKPALFVIVFYLDLWLLGYHHVIATFTKLGGTRADRKENFFLIYYLPLIVLAGVMAVFFTVGLWAVATIYFFWQWYHYTRQSYGIATFYRKKAANPVLENPHIAQATLWCVPVWGVLNRSAQGWNEFLFLPIWMPPVPQWVAMAAGVISIALILNWIISVFAAWKKGSVPLGHTLFMASHFALFYIAYIAIDSINTGWLVANIWHNAQYILFVWLYNRRRFAKENEEKNWLAWISQPGPLRLMCYFAACLALTTMLYGTLMVSFEYFASHDQRLIMALYVISFQTINFHHYVVDSKIWKVRKQQHQAVMNIQQVP